MLFPKIVWNDQTYIYLIHLPMEIPYSRILKYKSPWVCQSQSPSSFPEPSFRYYVGAETKTVCPKKPSFDPEHTATCEKNVGMFFGPYIPTISQYIYSNIFIHHISYFTHTFHHISESSKSLFINVVLTNTIMVGWFQYHLSDLNHMYGFQLNHWTWNKMKNQIQ